MKAVILCGGQGTRIRDVSEVVPKPMLPIGPYPVLWHIMKIYAAAGIKDFVLCLGYKGWAIKEYFLQYRAMTCDVTLDLGNPDQVTYHGQVEENDWRITLVDTGEYAETGARVWKARRYFEDDEHFFLTYGDGVADLDLNDLRQQHGQSGMTGTLSGVRPAGRFGELEFDDNQVVSFNEKPNALGGYINGGYMVFNTHDALPFFRDGDDLNLEREVLPAMVKKGVLGVYKHDGFWQCMDTRREHDLLNDVWQKGTAPWKVWP